MLEENKHTVGIGEFSDRCRPVIQPPDAVRISGRDIPADGLPGKIAADILRDLVQQDLLPRHIGGTMVAGSLHSRAPAPGQTGYVLIGALLGKTCIEKKDPEGQDQEFFDVHTGYFIQTYSSARARAIPKNREKGVAYL